MVEQRTRQMGAEHATTLGARENLVAFLASDEAGFITGGLHLVDGGAQTMRYPDIPARIADLAAG